PRPRAERRLLLRRRRAGLGRVPGGQGQLQPGQVGEGLVLDQAAVDLGARDAGVVVVAVLRGHALAQPGPGDAVLAAHPAAQLAAGIDQRTLDVHRAAELVADQRAL